MATKRMFWLLFGLVGFLLFQVYSACGPGETATEPGQEATVSQEGQKEAGTTSDNIAKESPSGKELPSEAPSGVEQGSEPSKEPAPVAEPGRPDTGSELPPESSVTEQSVEQPSGAIKLTFRPKSGSIIDVKDVCIDVTFSSPVDKKFWEVTWTAKGGKPLTQLLPLDSSGSSARICFKDFLTQNTQYTLRVKVQGENFGPKGSGTATYTTKSPYKSGKAGNPGLTVNLQLKKVLEPALVNTFLGTINPNQILPILMHLFSRDSGTSGSIVMIGGLGRTITGSPHKGKDVFDNKKSPVTVVMPGRFEGRLFTAGPATFRVSLGTINLDLKQFRLSGLFNSAGTNFDDVRFSGLVDAVALTAALKSTLGIDVCTLLAGKCFKDKNGLQVLQMVGQMRAIGNPISFSALITTPLFLGTGLALKPSLEVYLTEAAAANGITTTWSTCKKSGDPNLPCDVGKGAKVTGVTVTDKVTLDSAKKKATIAVSSALDAATWYRVAVTAKNGSGKTYTTFTIFKTK